MKKCKVCGGVLRKIGTVEPDTLYVSSRAPALSPYDGMPSFMIFFILGTIIGMEFFEQSRALGIAIICLFGGFGAWLWRRPRPLYRCAKCNSEYSGGELSRFRR